MTLLRSLRLISLIGSIVAGAAAVAAPTSTPTFRTSLNPAVRINEVLTANTLTPNGSTFPDMIELYNSSAATADLSGKSLSDDPALPRKYVFPTGTTIPAGGFLVVYADDVTTAPGLHTGFALDSEGDQVGLYDTPAAGGGRLDVIVFGFQVPNHSLSRTGPSGDVWALTTPSFGAANLPALALGEPASVRINEWAGKITFRLDHDMIELYNTAPAPVALGGVRLTDDVRNPTRFTFPALSFIGGNGFTPLYGADFVFGLDGNQETISLLGENNEQIDQVSLVNQPKDVSNGRSPDGAATIVPLAFPTPGFSNETLLPAPYAALLANLRITEVMYQPAASANSSQYEFVELQNIGSSTLDLSGVRFTNGLIYAFPAGTTLAPGAFVVVANDRSSFASRYPSAVSALAPGAYSGGLDNTGETLALSLPEPWRVHIVRFRFEPSWYPSTAGGGMSLVPVNPATTPPEEYASRTSWRASAAVNGSPGAADPGTPVADAPARLSNLSVRAALAAGQPLIVGFVVSGGGSRNLLVRAAGPGLTRLGVPGAMEDPRLELYNDTTAVFQNDNWPVALADTFTSVGAFPFATGSLDAAFVQPVDGPRSVQARGTGAGLVLIEAYDTGSSASPRLINLSARHRVGTGDDILIAGFTVAGTRSKQLLVRAIGPRLAGFGVPGTLVDPKLELYTARGAKLIENDNWAASLATTFTAVGAFQLDANSLDAALVTTVMPGSYTVQVRGANGGTGEALIEIYEVR